MQAQGTGKIGFIPPKELPDAQCILNPTLSDINPLNETGILEHVYDACSDQSKIPNLCAVKKREIDLQQSDLSAVHALPLIMIHSK